MVDFNFLSKTGLVVFRAPTTMDADDFEFVNEAINSALRAIGNRLIKPIEPAPTSGDGQTVK